MKHLIINADGYGFTSGITRAIEECIEFGTVRSISANVNFKHADRLADLAKKYPELSIGCHVNPVVGTPVLPPDKVPSLLDENGEFFYKNFKNKVLSKKVNLNELRAEMRAQIEKARDLVGPSLSHIDFHMGLHRLPGVYNVFLDVVEESRVGRIRTHRYIKGMESQFPRTRHFFHMFESPARIPIYLWNLWLRKKALDRGFRMPDRWVGITNMNSDSDKITIENYLMMLKNLPTGYSEFVAHPGYVDDELKRWSTYLYPRVKERKILLNADLKRTIHESDVQLCGYRDISITHKNN